MKKPTMQMIADAIGASRITVWKVLNNRPGVSPALHKRILDTAVQMGYPVSDEVSPNGLSAVSPKPQMGPCAISVVVSRPDSSVFWVNIIHEIAKEAGKKNHSLLYTYVPGEISDGYTLPPILTSGGIQGIIILNVYAPELLSLLNKLPVPKVFLDCVSGFPLNSLSGDLVLLEGRHVVQKLTDTLISNGKRRIGFIGDIHYALTNRLRYEGFLASMHSHGLPVDERYCFTSPIGLQTYLSDIHAYLSSLPELPDAFVCVSDFVANCVYQCLSARGLSIPGDIALTGYDNMQEYLDMTEWLTTVDINTASVGRRLFSQIQYRIANPRDSFETIYLNPDIIYRRSSD